MVKHAVELVVGAWSTVLTWFGRRRGWPRTSGGALIAPIGFANPAGARRRLARRQRHASASTNAAYSMGASREVAAALADRRSIANEQVRPPPFPAAPKAAPRTQGRLQDIDRISTMALKGAAQKKLKLVDRELLGHVLGSDSRPHGR